ncbi:MAG TPA: heme-binding domain-containing protein [Longimicrobiales bacterium]
MRRRLTLTLVVLIVLFAGAQLIRPAHSSPATDATHTIQSQLGGASEAAALASVLGRSCGDCHSNATAWSAWPWYARVAPLSWVLARGVRLGREAVDFSEWTSYSPGQRRALLALSCQDARAGKMPMNAYMLLKPDAKLSAADVATICAPPQEAAAPAAAAGAAGPAAAGQPKEVRP